ncbi:hypothetical protein AB0436_28285 [Streptomyces sp. NPDC051322]|uniref:hypothetical protein n=1 Tax=Streptomyces sp. NPDC051322 TaxID=3154645 RepID=UPI00344D2EF9
MSDQQQYPYGQYGQHGQHSQQPPYEDPHAHGPYAQDPRAHEPYTQTWDGQTWDTQYQPVQQPYEPVQQPHQPVQQPYQPVQQPQQPYQPVQPPYEQPAPHPQPPSYAEPSYLQPQSYPLPPETPAPAPTPAVAPTPAPAYQPPVAGGPAYSAPSTVGNARITDAQRARAEGRSPVIAPGIQPAGLTAGLGLLLAVAAFGGRYAVAVPLLVLQALTAAGWFRLNGMWPARQGIALAFAGGVVADVALLVAGQEHGPAAIIGTLGVWVLLALVLQLRSHASPDEVGVPPGRSPSESSGVAGLMATIASSAFAIVATGTLAASMDAVTVGGIAVAVAVIARALPLPGPASVVVALAAAAGAGILAGGMTGLGAQGALLGVAAGGCALIGLRVASYDYPSRFVHLTAGVALPLTMAAPAVYLIGRVIG